MNRTLALVLLGMVALTAGLATAPTATAGCRPICDGLMDEFCTQAMPCLDLCDEGFGNPDSNSGG